MDILNSSSNITNSLNIARVKCHLLIITPNYLTILLLRLQIDLEEQSKMELGLELDLLRLVIKEDIRIMKLLRVQVAVYSRNSSRCNNNNRVTEITEKRSIQISNLKKSLLKTWVSVILSLLITSPKLTKLQNEWLLTQLVKK